METVDVKKLITLAKLGLYDQEIKKVISAGDEAALSEAKSYADGKAAAVQAEVDALETLVGVLPEGATATDIVGYVQEKTAGIATEGAMTELGNRVGAVEGKVATIEGDYLKAADKAELVEDIGEVSAAVAAEKSRAEGIEAGLESRLAAVEGDYVGKEDFNGLAADVEANASAIELLTNGVSADEVDGVNDLIQYVKDHGTEVTGMKADIKANSDAIAAEKLRAEGIESGLDARLQAVEGAIGDVEDVAGAIATAKQEAIDAAASDASSKASAAETAAKTYADGLNTAMDARMDVVEGKAHEHANSDVLDGVSAEKVAAWDAAESNAKGYADGLNTAMDTRVAAVEEWQATMVECSDDDILALFA